MTPENTPDPFAMQFVPGAKSGLSIFEVQGPDGTIYEVEARSIEEAAAAVSQMGQDQKPWGQVLKENLFGDDDPRKQNFGEKVGSFLNKAGESLTLGLVGDEASAAIESILPGTNYDDRLEHYRGQERAFEEAHPVAALGAELVPLAVPGVGAASLAAKGANMGTRMGLWSARL